MSAPGDMEINERPRRPLSVLSRLSVVWLVPLAALILALVIAWSAISSRGPLIDISFSNGDGITAGTTELKFREVNVGKVERIHFSRDLSEVIVSVRVDSEIGHYIDEDAQFWIVRPEVSARGVSGLSTVFSGVYIQGDWNADPGKAKRSFQGLDRPPLIVSGVDGLEITLRAHSGGRLASGAPLIHKGITVGHMGEPTLSQDGEFVVADAVINAPFDKFITTSTRFWNASGFSITLGRSGLSFDVSSLAALIEGGVGFSNFLAGGQVVQSGHVFDVFTDELAARSAIYDDPNAASIPFSILFEGSVSGLLEGAPVEYQGLRIGSVTTLGAVMVDENDAQVVDMRAEITIQPERLGLDANATSDDTISFLDPLIATGLRARLASEGLLAARQKIELVDVPGAGFAEIDTSGDPFPIIPSAPPDTSGVANAAEGILNRVRELPIEQVVAQFSEMLANINNVLRSEGVRQAPEAALALIDDARNLITSDEVNNLISETDGAVADLREMLDRLREGAAISLVLETLDHAENVATSLDSASANLPELVQTIQSVASEARALPLTELVDSATHLVETADGLLGSQSTADIPAALTAALDELSLALAELREGGAVKNANETMAAARAAAQSIETAAAGLPELSDRLDLLAANADNVLNAYGTRSQFNQQTLAALVDLRDAARSITALARMLQRNPDALLRGR